MSDPIELIRATYKPYTDLALNIQVILVEHQRVPELYDEKYVAEEVKAAIKKFKEARDG